MTAKEMEQRLVELGDRFMKTRNQLVGAEYRDLHTRWMATKESRDHGKDECNRVVTDERERIGDHVTTVILKEYARGAPAEGLLNREWNSVVTWSPHTVPLQNDVEPCGHAPAGPEQLVPCPACGASTGDPCVNLTGKPYRAGTASHTARQDRFSLHKMLAAARPRIAWRHHPAGQTLLAAAARCAMCNSTLHAALAHLDHIIPFGLGGIDELHNIRVVCQDCNLHRPRDGRDLAEPLADLHARGLVISTRAWNL